MRKTFLLVLCLMIAILSPVTWSAVRLPGCFSDHMVIQQGQPVAVWGWADPGEDVVVSLSGGPSVATVADATEQWKVMLPATQAGGPFTLTVTGDNQIVVQDVMVGEVWLCSGQSNMEWKLSNCDNAAAEVAAANYPAIRCIDAPNLTADTRQEDVEANWTVCSPGTAGNYSGVAYFFARHLHRELGVPIGLIDVTWGGTRIEPWTPPEGFRSVAALKDIYDEVILADPTTPEYKSLLREHLEATEIWLGSAWNELNLEVAVTPQPSFPSGLLPITQHGSSPPQQPTALYNGMVSPFVGMSLRGAIWYQGESNLSDGMLYKSKMEALVQGWRQVWGIGDFPFYYVQLAPYKYNRTTPYLLPEIWEAQSAALSIPNTGMAVINDIGNLSDIHPRNKQDVGLRLALIALSRDYRQFNVASGPTYESMVIEGNKIRVNFENTGSGLVSRDGQALTWFEILGENLEYVTAEAVIDGNSVILSSPLVTEPAAMRFAWHEEAEPNLMNKEGLPASAFRAGDIPDLLETRVPEAADYELVYSIDLARLGSTIAYNTDNHLFITEPYDRIAYFLELQAAEGPMQYVFVSMDAFTDKIEHIGIPTAASGAHFQQAISNMTVLSNAAGIASGTGMNGGWIEFWPNNYGTTNSAGVPGADNAIYDFGDQPATLVDGYGSMQVHNASAATVLFAVNHWRVGASADIGIGNSTSQHTDWTFTGNASQYTYKNLRVLVRPKSNASVLGQTW